VSSLSGFVYTSSAFCLLSAECCRKKAQGKEERESHNVGAWHLCDFSQMPAKVDMFIRHFQLPVQAVLAEPGKV